MTTLLPSVNFDSNPGYSEWKFLHQIYSEEVFQRSLIGCNPGIVDPSGDPATAPFASTRPLFVSVNQSNSLALDLTKGYAVTPNHKLIVVNDNLSSIPLPDVVADKLYVLILEYKLIASSETRTNRFGNPAEVRLERPSSAPFGAEASTLSQIASVVSLTDYSNPSLFSTDRKLDIVVAAVLVVRADAITGQLSLLIDLTRTSFDFNRLWFSPVDVQHRAKVGSGVVTDNNPHGTQLQDLSSAGFTLYQQILPRGGVFSKDTTYYGYPGTFCQELVSISRYETDIGGLVTSDIAADLPPLTGRYFVTLTKVPSRVGSLYRVGEPWKPIPYYWKPGTRYLILATLEQPFLYGASLNFEYFSVSALMPPSESLTLGVQSFEVGEPTASLDYIISGGQAIDSLNQTSINLSAFTGPIKKAYNVICNTDGTLALSPQNLVPVIRIKDLVTQNQIAINQAPLNGSACSLTVGLTGVVESLSAAPGFDLNLKVRINGLDKNGGNLEEDITFRASQWTEQSKTELREEPLQFRKSKNKFQLINYIKILNTTTDPDNSGNDAILSVWANIFEASANQELANIASFFWDGSGGRRVTDTRLVATATQREDQKTFRFPNLLPENDAAFTQELFSVLLDPPLTDPNKHSRRLALELDDDRYLSETWKEFSSVDASGKIQVILYSLVTQGMTLRLSENKVLKFVTSSPNATLGQILIPSSLLTGDVEIKNNLVTTINNPIFDSTWFAEAGNTDVTLSRSESNPDGFAVCKRVKLQFSGSFTAGTINFTVKGIPITPVVSTGVHVDTLDLIVNAINAISNLTGISAVQVPEALSYIMFNGPVNGAPFIVTSPVLTGTLVTAGLSEPPDAFILTQPTDGILPTTHLPQRYLSAEKSWNYLSRAIPWPGVKLQAAIYFSGDVSTSIQNFDQIELVPGKILIARYGVVPPSINRSAGEFLVTKTGAQPLLDTLQSMADTINHRDFNSGCRATIDITGTKLLVEIGGYAAATIQLLAESIPTTWLIDSYTPIGGGHGDSTGFLKALHPLEFAEWRYQLILPAASVGTFTAGNILLDPSNQITLTGHGLSSGNIVYVQSTGAIPSGLVGGQNYYVVQVTANTFKLSASPGGTPVQIFTGGTGIHTLFVNAPFGPGNWSPYEPMEMVSPTAFKFVGPPAASLYCVQIRLRGLRGQPNGFSLYQLSPQVSGATLGSIDIRLTALDDPITGEVVLARGSTPSLDARLTPTINLDGSRVQDPEVTDARSSTVRPPQSNVKNRLDIGDGLTYWLTGSDTNYANPTAMGNLGIPNHIVSGKADALGNSDFFTAASPAINNLKILGSDTSPLIVSLNGNYYRLAKDSTVSLTSYPSGTYYIHAEIREIVKTFAPADVTIASDNIAITSHGLRTGDPVKFSSSGGLPAGLSASVTYYVNSVLTLNTFSVSAINYAPNTTVDITTQGTGTHTVTLVNQELGQTIFAGTVSVGAFSGTSILESATVFAPTVNDMIATQKTPLVLYIPSMTVGTQAFISPILSTAASNRLNIAGQFPSTLVAGTYFEVRSYRECSFTFSNTRTESTKKLPLGQITWNGTTVSNARCGRYLDKYTSAITSLLLAAPTYGSVIFDHNLGKIPSHFQVLYHTTSLGDVNPVSAVSDSVVQVTTTQIIVTNRYDTVIVKDITRTNLASGYLQLII